MRINNEVYHTTHITDNLHNVNRMYTFETMTFADVYVLIF